MSDDRSDLDAFLTADPADPGCDPGVDLLDLYVEMELAGLNPASRYPGMSIHLRSCADCRRDHDGLLDLARSAGEVRPPV